MSDLDSALPSGPRTPRDYRRLAENIETAPEVLRALVGSEYPFVLEALAANPRTPPDALLALVPTEAQSWNESARLRRLADNPSSDSAVLLAVLTTVAAALAGVRERGHPYSVALALAERPEVPTSALEPLGSMPGASARFRRSLTRALATRM